MSDKEIIEWTQKVKSLRKGMPVPNEVVEASKQLQKALAGKAIKKKLKPIKKKKRFHWQCVGAILCTFIFVWILVYAIWGRWV